MFIIFKYFRHDLFSKHVCKQGLLFNQSKEMSKVKFIEAVDLSFTLSNYIILVPCPSLLFLNQAIEVSFLLGKEL